MKRLHPIIAACGLILVWLSTGAAWAQHPTADARQSDVRTAFLRRLRRPSQLHTTSHRKVAERQSPQAGAQDYDEYIQADSHPENTVELAFAFASDPGQVCFSSSGGCGSFDPTCDDPEYDSSNQVWWVRTLYNPCEEECSSITITADPASGAIQTKTVHLDDRYHIGCCEDSEQGVITYDPNTGQCMQAHVTVTVIPSSAGSVAPSSGDSYWDPIYSCYVFFSTYTPSCDYAGRVRVKFQTTGSDIVYSFEQNTAIYPSSAWQTISDTFCPEGYETNHYQLYRMYLYADLRYNFSLCEADGVGAACDADGDMEMFDSSCSSYWSIDGEADCNYHASTIGTDYEDWSPPSDGYYFLKVTEYYDEPMSYTLAYLGQEQQDDPYEENDTLETAYDLSGDEQIWLDDLLGLGVQADDDWYKIYVDPGYERVMIECLFTHDDGDIDIMLCDSLGNELDRSPSETDNEYIDYVVSGAGTYYIKVYYDNAGNTYDLWWDDMPPPNHDPILSAGYVDPNSGSTDTDFYWYVEYYDQDGDAPSTKSVYIDGASYTMTLHTGSASDGIYSYGPKKLSPGNHDYYFYFDDGRAGSDRLPQIGTIPGPRVQDFAPKPPVPHLNWSQPPIEVDPTSKTPLYYGWDELSFRDPNYLWQDHWIMAADDFPALGAMPVTSVHWWGSYRSWYELYPPPQPPAAWRIGFWSNASADPCIPYARPELLLRRIDVPGDRVQQHWVGYDRFPDLPPEACYQYHVQLEPGEYFCRPDSDPNTADNVYWLSITAVYPTDVNVVNPWGWKTRPSACMGDAVRFELFDDPHVGTELDPCDLSPLQDPQTQQNFDLAFELNTDPNYISWEQEFTGIRNWPYFEDVNSSALEDANQIEINQLVADDWLCRQASPVRAVVWWGSYKGYTYEASQNGQTPPPNRPDYFYLSIWTDLPAGADPCVPYSHPDDLIWQYSAHDYEQVLVGYDKHPHAESNEPVFRYSVRLPEQAWFLPDDTNNIYWFSTVAVYDSGNDPCYPWGWTNHQHVFGGDAVAARLQPTGPTWTWTSLYDQNGVGEDMSFSLFTETECMRTTHPAYDAWAFWDKPDCWCYPRQCKGDIDGRFGPDQNPLLLINEFRQCVNKFEYELSAADACADFDHIKTGPFRVAIPDLFILRDYISRISETAPNVPECDKTHIHFWTAP